MSFPIYDRSGHAFFRIVATEGLSEIVIDELPFTSQCGGDHLSCYICGMSIPAGETYYDVSFTKKRETQDGSIEVLDRVSLLACCIGCGDKEDIHCLLKKLCEEAVV